MTEREALLIALETYLCREMPAGTIIGDPKWWAPKIAMAIKEVLAQPEQEPVAWDGDCVLGHCGFPAGCEASNCCRANYTTTPPQRKPLTDEMTKQMRERCDSYEMRGAFVDGWVSAEAAHGIKE